jgi:hypothetical protein
LSKEDETILHGLYIQVCLNRFTLSNKLVQLNMISCGSMAGTNISMIFANPAFIQPRLLSLSVYNHSSFTSCDDATKVLLIDACKENHGAVRRLDGVSRVFAGCSAAHTHSDDATHGHAAAYAHPSPIAHAHPH